MYHLVYLTKNKINNKIYVGVHSTFNLEDGYLGSGFQFILALKKYGKENFERVILHYCLTAKDALDIEKYIVDEKFVKLKNNYNVATGGGSGNIVPMTQERKDNISKSNKGRSPWNKNVPMNEELRLKLSMQRIGTKLSQETKNKISKSSRGRSPWNKNVPMNEETKNKISKSLMGNTRRKGVPQSEETKYKISKTHKGKKNPSKGHVHSQEEKARMSDIMKNKPKILCEFCGKLLDKGNYTKNHGMKCKHRL